MAITHRDRERIVLVIRTARVAIFVIAAFVLVDIAFRHASHASFARPTFRFANDTRALLTDYLAWLSANDEPTIHFIGDSTIQGQRLDAANTPPALVAALLHDTPARDYRVANIGLTATKLPDAFYITHRIGTRPGDVFVYNINYKNFGAWDLGVPMRFPDLYAPDADRFVGAGAREAVRAGPSDSDATADPWARGVTAAEAFARDHWFFYRNRDIVNAWIFGLHPRKLARSYYQVAVASGFRASIERLSRRRAARRDWTETRWDDWAIEVLRSYYDVAPLDDTNPVFRFLGPTARLAREREAVPIFFANPMNRALNGQFGLVDADAYTANLHRVKAAVEGGGGIFLDYSDLVPGDEFFDNDHMNPAGSRRLAQALARDIAGALARRGEAVAP
ncbi:hypothetical protein K8I61_10510 [bacterium]|nr:hypothetical protein [bacterium]